MKVGITISKSAYTPEAFAYERYLTNLGHKVELEYEPNPSNDINIYFMGLRPLWKTEKIRAIEIHEYQSLSTPPYAQMKNKLKRIVNRKPSGRIFLNDIIRDNIKFKDNIPYILRDMGVEKELFQKPSKNPKYDIVYCGSISGRPGLIETILNLSNSFKIVVVGQLSNAEKEVLSRNNITLLGSIERSGISDIYKEARYGLNFTPDIFPYNIQTSTKTLEYMAAGLDIISNKYKWTEDFFLEIDYNPYWLDTNIISQINQAPTRLKSYHQHVIRKHSWENILIKSNLEGFLRECINNDIR